MDFTPHIHTLSLSGTDNAQLNIGTGGTLGTAAFADTRSFQPAGGALNLVGIDNSTAVTCDMTGTKTFTVATGLGFSTGMVVTALYTADPTIYMLASVSSYNGSTLVLSQPTASQGSCLSCTGWTIQISGPVGAVGATGAGAAPVGSGELWWGSALPTSYLWASGPSYVACVSKTTYSGLYAAIGDTWTTANSCTTGNFGIPDMRGRLPMGTGQGATAEGGGTGTNRVIGATGGAETHTQTQAELATHAHSVYDPGHTHVAPGYWDYSGGNGYGGGAYWWNAANSSTQYSATGISLYNAGSSSPMAITDPFAVVNYIIRYQ